MVNRPVLSDRLAYTCDSADFRSGISATREDFIAVPSAAVTTRPETVHGGGSFSAGLAFWAAETSGSSKKAAATLNSADNIWHNPQSGDVLAILPCLSTGCKRSTTPLASSIPVQQSTMRDRNTLTGSVARSCRCRKIPIMPSMSAMPCSQQLS
jgi:hypothetical protein